MPKPLSICIEDLRASDPDDRYTRCVALPGGQPGLGLDPQGRILWQTGDPVACELWISGDDKLILRRREGAPPTEVRRAGRATSVPAGKPVVLLDQDEVHVGDHGFRIHVHGAAPDVHAPTPLKARIAAAAGIAAAVALTVTPAAPVAAGEVEVRERPPEMMAVPPERDAGTAAPKPAPKPVVAPDAGTPKPQPLEIRQRPPEPMPSPAPEPAPAPKKK